MQKMQAVICQIRFVWSQRCVLSLYIPSFLYFSDSGAGVRMNTDPVTKINVFIPFVSNNHEHRLKGINRYRMDNGS